MTTTAPPTTPAIPTRQPLPPNARSPLPKEFVAQSLIATFDFDRDHKRVAFSEPLWTSEVRNAHRQGRSMEPYQRPDSKVVTFKGPLEGALRLANGRAMMTANHSQAQAVLDGRNGSYLITGLGSFTGSTFNYVPIDGTVNDNTFANAFGKLNKVTSHMPDLKAIVGSSSYINFSSGKVETDLAPLDVKTVVDA